MKKVLVLNGSNLGTTMYFAEKIIQENANKHEVKILDLSKLFKDQLLTSETVLSGSFYADADICIEALLEADTIIAVSSMTNYGMSDTFKTFINKVLVNGKTFEYGPNGPTAILEEKFRHKEVIILFTSGSPKEYLPQAAQQTPQMIADAFKFIGFTKISINWGGGTNMPDMMNKSLDEKYEALREKIYFEI
jgi:FMN-dependent NADH-azoreductase